MILCFDDNFDNMTRSILSKTFKSNCRDIGIAQHDIVVEMRRGDLNEALGLVTRLSPDRFLTVLNGHNTLAESIFATGHEMVHVHQHIRGDLVHVDGGVRWQGQFFPRGICMASVFYDNLPWEIEASKRDGRLFDSAIRTLTQFELYIVTAGEMAAVA